MPAKPLLSDRTIRTLQVTQQRALAIPGLALPATIWAVALPPVDDGGPVAPLPTVADQVEGRVVQDKAQVVESAAGQLVSIRPWRFVQYSGTSLPIGAILSADDRRFRVGASQPSPTYPTYALEAL